MGTGVMGKAPSIPGMERLQQESPTCQIDHTLPRIFRRDKHTEWACRNPALYDLSIIPEQTNAREVAKS